MSIGRNDPCPCGSGKKFKKCCLKVETAKIESRSSLKMVDDWIQEGYDVSADSRLACDVWEKAWAYFKTLFTPELRTADAVNEMFGGVHIFSNWVGDFETELLNASLEDKAYAEKGIRFITDYLAQFPDDDELTIKSFCLDLTEMYCRTRQQAQREAEAMRLIERWPDHAVGYIAMATAVGYRHDLSGNGSVKDQLDWLERAKSRPVIDGPDYDLDRRIGDLRDVQTGGDDALNPPL